MMGFSLKKELIFKKGIKMKKLLRIQLLIIAAGLALLATGCTYQSLDTSKIDTSLKKVEAPTSKIADATFKVEYQGQDGKNALELLKINHKVVTKTYEGIGEFVQTIDNQTPDSNHFFSLYINGEYSQVGADAYQTKSSDKLEWRVQEITE
jgi:hypothetical protein